MSSRLGGSLSDGILSVITYLGPLVGLTALVHTFLMSRHVLHRDTLRDITEHLARVERDLVACETARQQYYRENIELLKRLARIETTRQDTRTGRRQDHFPADEPNGPIPE